MLPGRCRGCGAPVELRTGTNPIATRDRGHDYALTTVRWEDRGTGEQHVCPPLLTDLRDRIRSAS